MIEFGIDENDITISRSSEEISLRIENSLDCLTINMTDEEAKKLICALQETIFGRADNDT